MFSVRDRIFFDGSCTLADLVSPSRLETSSGQFPMFLGLIFFDENNMSSFRYLL